MNQPMKIDVQDIDYLGLIAGIVDELGIVEITNRLLGKHPLEEVSAGHVVKAFEAQRNQAGRFVLATNLLDDELWSNDTLLQEYKNQQSCERGFRFLKDPLFFTSRLFVKLPQRVAALAMIMGLCLLAYSIGQRRLRQALAEAGATIPNQIYEQSLKLTKKLEKMIRILNRFCSNFIFHLSKSSKIDGRFLLVALLMGYFLPLFCTIFSHNYPNEWNSPWIYPLVPKMFPPFADMRVITSGSECIRLGYDVIIENPCDPWKRPLNYPRIWSLPASWGLDQSHTVFLGILCGLLFFIFTLVIIERLNYIEALIYALILCSPSVMLAVERGNNDLIIFTLLAVSLLILKSRSIILRAFSYILVLFAAIVKLYPIFALLTCLKEKKRTFTFISLAILIAFGIYVISEFESLNLVSHATPRATYLSYGGMVILDIAFNKLTKYFPALLNYHVANLLKRIVFFLIIVLVFLIAYLGARVSNKQASSQDIVQFNLKYIDSFRIGASIYLGSYLIGNNWDYRLIFLLFTIPQLLAWIKSKNQISILSMSALIGISLTVWLGRGSFKFIKVYYFGELINWLLFLFFVYTLILTLPKWIKNYIYFQPKDLQANPQ